MATVPCEDPAALAANDYGFKPSDFKGALTYMEARA